MCGITGIVSYSKEKKQEDLNKTLKAMKHRGPDGEGWGGDGIVKLGMKRLAIIDITGGQQPLYNENKSIGVIGNGEIYNYIELQKKLSKKHNLRTRSDIETVVHLYEDYGLGFVEHLRGMFALALYDKNKGRLILARDRFGEKPLYYYKEKDFFAFASELKAILQIDGIDKGIDFNAIDAYFHYYYVPEPDTPFKKIKKLPAGSLLILNINNAKVKIKKYYDFSSICPDKNDSPTEAIFSGLQEACKLTLRSDVPVGIFLSGGLDSGTILALSAPFYKDKMKAFTVGYERKAKSDERSMAKYLAEKYDVEHIEMEIRTEDMVRDFPKTVYYSDDPIADIAAYSIYSVSKLARESGIKVLLGGLGGDELFWGYQWVRESVRDNLKQKSGEFAFYNKQIAFKNAERFIDPLLSKEFKNMVKKGNSYKYFSKTKTKNELDTARKSMDLIREIWLKGDPISLNDRISMATSVELRSPLLDYKLAEIAYSYKKNVLAYSKGQKYWMKEAVKDVIPEKILNLPKKGFAPPVFGWAKAIIENYVYLLENGELVKRGILKERPAAYVKHFWKTVPVWWYTLYQLVLLEVWFRIYVEGQDYKNIRPKNA